MHHAWHTAALVRQGVEGLFKPEIEMTPLAELLSGATPRPAAAAPAKTADELEAAFVAWLGPPPAKTGD